jgi:hypothetical protein
VKPMWFFFPSRVVERIHIVLEVLLVVMPILGFPKIHAFAVITWRLLFAQQPTTKAMPQTNVPAKQQK